MKAQNESNELVINCVGGGGGGGGSSCWVNGVNCGKQIFNCGLVLSFQTARSVSGKDFY